MIGANSQLDEEDKKQAIERVEALLQEGLDTGPATPMTAGDWDNLRQRLQGRLASPAKTLSKSFERSKPNENRNDAAPFTGLFRSAAS